MCPSVRPSVRLSVCLSVHLYVTCCCFFVILFCSCECRSHCCCSCHVGLKPVLFATQPKIANSVSSCSSSVPSTALCVVSSGQCDGCDHVVVVVACVCVVSSLVLLSCLSHVLRAYIQKDAHVDIDKDLHLHLHSHSHSYYRFTFTCTCTCTCTCTYRFRCTCTCTCRRHCFCSFSHEQTQSGTLTFFDVCFSKPLTFHSGFMFFASRSFQALIETCLKQI